MEAIKALDASVGQDITAIIAPTFKIWTPLLIQNKGAIQAIPRTTESYGSHARQELDVYRAPNDSDSTPILVFLHGGGLVRGEKISPQIPDNLVYANLGSFFASRGITTINPNYRLVNSPFGGHDAVYPSGGGDVAAVLKWLEGFGGKRDVYLLGNSAGGVHISTFLLHPQFLAQRQKYTSGSGPITLKGVIELAVPLHFKAAAPERSPMLNTYYGSKDEVAAKAPYGLLEALAGKSMAESGIPKTLALVGEFDPVGEIIEPMKDFVALWEKTFGEGIQLINLEGHNHISPVLSVMSGDVQGEKWGEIVVKWILGS